MQYENNFSFSSQNASKHINNNYNIIKSDSLFYKIDKEKNELNALELNDLEYEEAIIYDKRSFIKTYWNIICREHKIIFTFFICNDYNLLYIYF